MNNPLKMKNKEPGYFRRFINSYFVILAVLVAFIAGLVIGNKTDKFPLNFNGNNENNIGQVYNKNTEPSFLSNDLDFDIFWDVWQTIENNYVKQPVNETKLLYGAMAGSVASLGDPHSVFFDPETTQEFTQELKGSFEGIGAEIAIKNDRLTIVAPLPDSPAQKAGLRSGDKVYAIDGEDTTGISLDYAVSKIRGPRGSEVDLTVSRNGLEDLQDFKITRDKIKIESVKWTMLDNDIVHLELRYFNEDTWNDFNQAVLEIVNQNPKGIILDLRNNPGGYLDTAVSVASEWIEDGVVVYEQSSTGDLTAHEAQGRARLQGFPTIVLINKGSASGSEILAGALKDYGLATLVGETSFGKGSVQTLFPLRDGSSLKLTIAEWLTPNKNTIDQVGIDPDIEVPLTEDDFNNDLDPQLDAALGLLNGK